MLPLRRWFSRWMALPLSVRWAILLWFALLAGVTGRVLASPPTSQSVVPIYRQAAERWQAGTTLYVYELGMPIDVYRNPPGFAAAFQLLGPLPEKSAALLWRWLSAAVFLLGLYRFCRATQPNWSPARLGFVAALAVLIALPAVNNGQVNLLIAASALGGTAAVLRHQWWPAAGWLALGPWLKVYPVAVGLLLGLIEPRRLLPRFLLVTGVGFLVPFLLQDPDYVLTQYREFVTTQVNDDRTYAHLSRVTRDWTIIPRVWFGWVSPPIITKSVMLAMAALAAGLMLCWRRLPMAAPTALLLGMTWMTLFGPATEAHTYAQLAGVAPWLVVAAARQSRWAFAWAGLGYMLLALTVLRAIFPADWKFNALGPQAIGTGLLLLAGYLVIRREHSQPSENDGLSELYSKRWNFAFVASCFTRYLMPTGARPLTRADRGPDPG